MGHGRTLRARRTVDCSDALAASPASLPARADCLEQLLQAFRDIADRDDIHQAASRLALVQEWIRNQAKSAAADPIFADLPLASYRRGAADS